MDISERLGIMEGERSGWLMETRKIIDRKKHEHIEDERREQEEKKRKEVVRNQDMIMNDVIDFNDEDNEFSE